MSKKNFLWIKCLLWQSPPKAQWTQFSSIVVISRILTRLYFSHDVEVVKFMAQDVGVMKEGRLVFS